MPRILRVAHPVDIARHLANSPHPAVSVHAITEGVGMGNAQLKLWDAVHAAVEAGYVTRTGHGGLDLGVVTLTDLGRRMASTDPDVHSIHLTDTHMPTTVEPADQFMSCSLCYETYKVGEWQLLLSEARNRSDNQLTMCRRCATDIGRAVASFPAEPAPWVDYA